MKDLKDLVRPNVWNLKPYSSARDEFHGDASVFLDANENPWNVPYNRYPDPLQWKLKDRLAVLKGVDRSSIFLGNGSDEAIDLVIRAFCEPGLGTLCSFGSLSLRHFRRFGRTASLTALCRLLSLFLFHLFSLDAGIGDRLLIKNPINQLFFL